MKEAHTPDNPPTRLWPIARWVELFAVVVGMGAVFWEFGIELPRDRDRRDVQLHATVATLSAEKRSIVHHSLHERFFKQFALFLRSSLFHHGNRSPSASAGLQEVPVICLLFGLR